MNLLLQDSSALPEVFLWNGAVAEQALRSVASTNGWRIPPDLLAFWRATGGGWIFETEHLLSPIPAIGSSDDVGAATKWYQEAGLMDGLITIHQGLGLTAVSLASARYLYFDNVVQPSKVLGEYASMNQWYVATLRSEYAARYGLPAVESGDL